MVTEVKNQPSLITQKGISEVLGLYVSRLGQKIPRSMVLMGHTLQAKTHQKVRLDDPASSRGHSQILQGPD